jgi:hypothetical protein
MDAATERKIMEEMGNNSKCMASSIELKEETSLRVSHSVPDASKYG